MTIAGHQTSISLEPLFWDALKNAADVKGLPVNALVAQIDVERLESGYAMRSCERYPAVACCELIKSTVTKFVTVPLRPGMFEFPIVRFILGNRQAAKTVKRNGGGRPFNCPKRLSL